MTALTRFRLLAYVRSHRAFQPLVGLLAVLAILYASRVPTGSELGALADSAGILLPVLAWAARGLLDNEPDEQRAIALSARGTGEMYAGLAAAALFNTALVVIALVWPLLVGFEVRPSASVILAGVLLHLLAVLAGTALGALTSRPITPSPAVSTSVLIGAYLGTLALSTSRASWLSVPVMDWMRAAHHDELFTRLPALLAPSLLW